MLDGVVRFPPEFAARYRAKGYWQDRSLRDTFDEAFQRYADRLEHYCRLATDNWFNFYDFWEEQR